MLIAGLGNPGKEYEDTRHNVGFLAADAVAEKFRCVFSQKMAQALLATFAFKGEKHFLIKPQTYMNLSGESISKILRTEDMKPKQLLVLLDDFNLPMGRIRLRPQGGSGGHNGLKSIIGYIGEDFWRLRVGVGKPEGEDMVSHVLDNFPPEEFLLLKKVLKDVPQLVSLMLLGKVGKAMSVYNAMNYGATEQPPP